jgi:methionine salvage enolase-phosphatase E1
MIKADRKITSLKQLQVPFIFHPRAGTIYLFVLRSSVLMAISNGYFQGHIWRTGFESKELHGVVFEDVPEALKDWQSHGVKVFIWSNSSEV